MSKHFGEKIIGKVLELREQGYTLREISQQLGFEHIQIERLIKRFNKKQRTPIASQPKGRPCVRKLTADQKKDLRIRQLEREVELYRSFLQAAGRM